MSDYQRVLLATDFSDCSQRARDVACQLADKFDAKLHVIHVIHKMAVEVPDFGMGLAFPGYLENIPETKKKLSDKAQEMLAKEIAENWKESHQATFSIRFGVPDEEIVDYASQNNIDMIVIGTHGRSGLPHLLLGSVAERVIHRASCPVVTVKQE